MIERLTRCNTDGLGVSRVRALNPVLHEIGGDQVFQAQIQICALSRRGRLCKGESHLSIASPQQRTRTRAGGVIRRNDGNLKTKGDFTRFRCTDSLTEPLCEPTERIQYATSAVKPQYELGRRVLPGWVINHGVEGYSSLLAHD